MNPHGADQPMTTATDTQSDLFAWAKDLERENKRIAEINAARVRNLCS